VLLYSQLWCAYILSLIYFLI